MIRLAFLVLVWLMGVNALTPIRADDFTIDLQAQAAGPSKIAAAKYPPPDAKAQPRAVLIAGVNTPITVKWTVRNTDKAATVKDALVHFLVVKVEKPDQQEAPKLTKGVVVESALTMDFKAQDKAEGEITVMVPNPGIYLLRLEIKGTAAKNEPFAALDLSVR